MKANTRPKRKYIRNRFAIENLIKVFDCNLLLRKMSSELKVNCEENLYPSIKQRKFSTYKPLPKFLKDKKAIVNVNNKDNRCFGFSILAALYHDHLPTHLQLRKSRPGTYKCLFTQHGLDKLAYPVGVEDVAEIEKQIGIGINIFSYSDDKGVDRYPIYISKFWYNCETQGPQKTTVDLLYFENHWAAITNFSRFMADKKTDRPILV